MTNLTRDQIVSGVARRLVGEYLELAIHPEELLDKIESLAGAMAEVAPEVIPLLGEGLRHVDRRVRTFAGLAVLQLTSLTNYTSVPRTLLDEAADAVNAGLENGCTEERQMACVLLSNGGVPERAIGTLQRMMDTESEPLRTFAAAALSTCGPSGARAIPVLTERMLQNGDMSAAIAANALARLGIREAEAIQAMISLLDRAENDHARYYVVESLNLIGTRAKEATGRLMDYVLAGEAHPHLRRTAAVTIGSITRGTDEGLPLLADALSTDDAIVIDGAIEAYEILGHCPPTVVPRLLQLLKSPDNAMRWVAARGLKRLAKEASQIMPALVDAAIGERHMEVLQQLVAALAEFGEPVVPYMTQLLRQHDVQMIGIASAVLWHMGNDGAEALAQMLGSEPEPEIRKRIVLMLQQHGEKAGNIVPQLAAFLDVTTDEELAGHLVVTIFNTGSHAAKAIPSLVRCLAMRSGEATYWAERALWNIGPDAVGPLEQAMKEATWDAKRRIERAIIGMRASNNSQFAKFEKLNRDELLELFSYAGEVLSTCGAASWSNIADQLIETLGIGQVDALPFGASASSLRLGIKDLEKLLGVRLTTHQHGHRNGMMTAEGRSLLTEIKEYLESKRVQ